ncbi:MAG TPA: hypothetical protein VF549_08175 [Solirubrobacteraceae bacterium]
MDREGLLRLHSELRVEAPFEDFELVVLQAAAASVEVDRFALRVGHWRIDMPRRLLQTSVATGVLAAGIAAGGVSSVPVAVLAVVLPFLVDIDRIELRARDRIVLGRLRDLDARGGDPEAAYRRLPEDLRKQLTLMEFADVWDRLIEAGEIEPDGPNERARWKLPPQRGPRDDPDDPRYLPRPPA